MKLKEIKTVPEIARELGFSEDYFRKVIQKIDFSAEELKTCGRVKIFSPAGAEKIKKYLGYIKKSV